MTADVRKPCSLIMKNRTGTKTYCTCLENNMTKMMNNLFVHSTYCEMKDNEEKYDIFDKMREKGGTVFITLVQTLGVQF